MNPEILEVGKSVISALLFIFVLFVIAAGGIFILTIKTNKTGGASE